MLKKQMLITGLVVLMSLGLVGTVFAGENDYQGVLGADQFSFDAPISAAEQAAVNAAIKHNYDQDRLALAGTEAGDFEYRFDAPATKAELAAMNHVYDQERLDRIGTEAGDYKFGSVAASSDELASDGLPGKAICSSC